MVSPILANIYLDRLDQFVETVLIPAHTQGTARRRNPAYYTLGHQVANHRKRGRHELAAQLRKQMQQLPSTDLYDPGYRRLRYVRYADDFVLGFIGPKAEAEQIKESLETFLRDKLKLELSKEKTLITHATSQAAKFLGYELVSQQADDKHDRNGRRKVNGIIGLRVPAKVIEQHCRAYMGKGKPTHRSELLNEDDFTVVSRYQSEYRGVIQYYLLAQNVSHFGKLHGVMRESLVKTLVAKHKTRRRKLLPRYRGTVQTEHGPRACLRVVVQRGEGKRPLVAQFGGIPLKRNKQAVLADRTPTRNRTERNELIQRLLADKCEMCGSTDNIEVHHVRALRDLNGNGQGEKPKWVQVMAARRRKTLVVCRSCHLAAHEGSWKPQKQT